MVDWISEASKVIDEELLRALISLAYQRLRDFARVGVIRRAGPRLDTPRPEEQASA
jgi:hypothetical protein